jgi:hypothetical protein
VVVTVVLSLRVDSREEELQKSRSAPEGFLPAREDNFQESGHNFFVDE